MNTTIQIRIDQVTKTKAQRTFKNMGLDLSSGIKYFLVKIGNKNGLKDVYDLERFILQTVKGLKSSC